MPEIDYAYIPQFGIEKFKSTAQGAAGEGGAFETNDNLLITLWESPISIEALPPEPPLDLIFPFVGFGDIIRPFNAPDTTFTTSPFVGDTLPQELAAAFDPAMRSRVSSRFWFTPPFIDPEEPPETLDAYMAVLDPPQEYKQQMVNAVKRTGDLFSGAPGDPLGVEVLRTLQGNYAWNIDSRIAPLTQNLDLNLFGTLITFTSSYLPLPFGLAEGWIPFLRTNGADGNPPEFFDVTTNQGFDEMVDAVNRGEFYVAMWILDIIFAAKKEAPEGFGSEISIEWPHSTGRN